MTYIDFAKNPPPVLYGDIRVNDKVKTGYFKPVWNYYSNSLCYHYFTPKGRKGSGGFTLKRAYDLFTAGRLTQKQQTDKQYTPCDK